MNLPKHLQSRGLRTRNEGRAARKAAVAVEAAVMMPLLLLLMVIAVDYARVYKDLQVIADSARIGALFAADPDLADCSGYETVEEIVLAAAVDLSPQPTVSVEYGTDSCGDKYAEVTVTHSFRLLTRFLTSQPLALSRKARARLRPAALE